MISDLLLLMQRHTLVTEKALKKRSYYFLHKGISRPYIKFTFSNNITWDRVGILLHSDEDFPDAALLNGMPITKSLQANIFQKYFFFRKLNVNISPSFCNVFKTFLVVVECYREIY